MNTLNVQSSVALPALPVCAGAQCPACGAEDVLLVYRNGAVPSNSCILMSSREDAVQYPRGDLSLGHCEQCGFVGNTAFDPALTVYSGRYEETQGFSSTFQAFQRDSARHLVTRYGLRSKYVLEIGCGKGEFLSLICELGNNRGIGFDPAYVPARNHSPAAERIDFVTDYFSEQAFRAHAVLERPDCVLCRMTLEHIPDPLEFVSMVRRAIGDYPGTIVYFLVPNASRIFKRNCFEDIYYEHCCYFTPGALARLFDRCGFEVLDLETLYDGQYVAIECRPGSNPHGLPPLADDLADTRRTLRRFAEHSERYRNEWLAQLAQMRAAGKRVVLWGSGSKAVAFLTTLGLGPDAIEYVVDINPYRHGCYIPGSGQRIVPPKVLSDYRPDVVIVMNRVYVPEIQNDLAALGLEPELLAL